MAGRWHTLFCCLCCLKLPDSSVALNHFWVCNTANVKSMDEFVAKTISPGALHRTAQWLHPSATPMILQAPDTAASAPALQTGPSARSSTPTVQIYLINYIMIVQHPGKGDAFNNVTPVDNSISVSMDLWRQLFHGAHPLQAWKSFPGQVSKEEVSMLLTHTLAREKGHI